MSTMRAAGKSMRTGDLQDDLVLVDSQYGYRSFIDINTVSQTSRPT